MGAVAEKIITKNGLQNETEVLKVEYFDDRFYKTQLKKIPEGVPENLIFQEDEEIYLYAPSVTTIISKGMPNSYLARWRGNIGNDLADWISFQARVKGSNIHEYCAVYSDGGIVVYLDGGIINDLSIEQIKKLNPDKIVRIITKQEEMVQVHRFQKLLNELNPEITEIENKVFYMNEGLIYAGTIDYVWNLEGGEFSITQKKPEKIEAGKYIVDIKTGNSFDVDNYAIQVSAYAKAYGDIDGAIIIHLNSNNKTGIEGIKLEILNKEDIEIYFKQFVNLYNTFIFSNKNLKPDVFDIPVMLSKEEIKLK